MKLYSARYTPNPRRVLMFLAEKGVTDLEIVTLDIFAGAHKTPEFRRRSPLAQLPALELDDGRTLTESRAICSYLESLYPEPNLIGEGGQERAFIEMWDRRIEFGFAVPFMLWVRHAHPLIAALETQNPVLASHYQAGAEKMARWLDGELGQRPWIAGERFTIADITACCGMDFAKLLNWRPGPALPNLARWREALAERPAGGVGIQ